MELLKGKTAIITGASRGIGKGIALAFAQNGANIAFTYLSSDEKAKALEAELGEYGITAKGFKSDASNFEAAQTLADDVMSTFGSIDVLVNNAGITKDNLLIRMSEEDFDKVMEVNLKSIFNLTKIYQQIDYNDSLITEHFITRGSFHWLNGEKDTKVVWTPDKHGRFKVSWLPPKNLQNNVHTRNGMKLPGNEHIGSFGCDSYDISGVVGGGGSNGALHGMTKFHMDDAPSNHFFLEYVARPQTAEIFFEDVLMACVFYGMPVLAENNKPRLLYHLKNRGYRGFSLNRPDKHASKLSKTERELGGIPNTSEDVKQSHASAVESYIEKHVGIDMEGTYRPVDDMGEMYFTRTLEDWARFDINNRTKFDATISSGLAIMANQKHMYLPEQKQSKISINFARYNNRGSRSELLQ